MEKAKEKKKYPDFAGRLKEMRTELNLRPVDLAKRAGLNRSDIHYYEKGMTSPGLHALIKLADAFGVSLDHLVGRDPPI